jgi:hypothetical protein
LLDRHGHSTELFLAGDITNTGPENRAYRLNKENGVWQLLPLRYEGDATGPVSHGQLFQNRFGKLHAVLRQGKQKSSDFNGRVLLAQETDDAAQPWSIEIIQAEGNQGFAPWVEFDEKGQVQKIIQLDYGMQRLKQHIRPSPPTPPGGWPGKVVVGFAGTIHDIKDANGKTHFLISRLQGFDSWPPYIYSTLEGDPTEIQSNSLARIPLRVTQDHLIGWNERYRELYALSLVDKTWRKIQSLPAEMPQGINPFFDTQNRLWWPIPAGKQIKLIGLDINMLMESPSREPDADRFLYACLELDKTIAPECQISGRLNGFGHLEFVILNQNSDIQLGVIESEETFLRN